MMLKQVSAHNRIDKTFDNIISNGRLAHAYIFLGTQGVGKSFFTKQFVKRLNCKNNDKESCGICSNCLKIDADTSPDVYWISVGKEKKFLGIDQIKDLQYTSTIKPVELSRKIYIIKNANKLSEEASNCILKVLEEPPASTLIILITNSLNLLPETVISRCQIIKFSKLQNDFVFKTLSDNYDMEEEEVEWAVKVSNGSIGFAAYLIEKEIYSKNKIILKELSNLSLIDNFSFAKTIIDWITVKDQSNEEKRTHLKLILELFLVYYRDLLIYNTQAINQSLIYSNNKSLIKHQNRLLTSDAITKIIDQIFIAFDNLESNGNINILVENLITNIALILSSTLKKNQ